MLKYIVLGGNMDSLGKKIRNIRLLNNLKQSEMAEIFCVSEKTISSWENDRTIPDLNMIYKISDYFKRSFYYLISDDYNMDNNNEIEIKLMVLEKEYNRILNLIKNESVMKRDVNQRDTYYSLNNMNNNCEWLRIRNEDGRYIFNYKKKIDDNRFEKYDVLIDNDNNLNNILLLLGGIKIGSINKKRVSYIYRDKYEFSFDIVENIGRFIEIKFIDNNINSDFDVLELLNVLEELKIDLNMIEYKKYINYIL